MRYSLMTSSLLLVGLLAAGCAAPKPVSTGTLLAEMTDLAGMAEFPHPAYTCRQFSSYDRASTSPADAETWFANRDVNQYLRSEERSGRTEYVMMDTDGPGAIVRIWSANPKGTLRIYLDHNETPALEAPMTDLLGGQVPGIPEPIAGERSRGWNSYLPIPYARHCKVTSDEDGFYYHVNYRTYPWATRVETFTQADLRMLGEKIGNAAAQLAAPQAIGQQRRRWTVEHAEAGLRSKSGGPTILELGGERVAPGETCGHWGAEAGEGGAIFGLRVRVEAEDLPAALRSLIVELEFDGRKTVECPLGDFFGAAPGLNPYTSLPCGVTDDGEMWCHWVMPYRSSASGLIRNVGDQPASVKMDIAAGPYSWTRRSMHFHAQWRGQRDVPTRPMQDWNYVDIKGQGVFAGASFSIANPVRAWWGEGDEKIYVDGEEFPSHFGTGTEDYYGYAWCCNEPFMHAYHNQPRCDGPGNYGHTSVNRWHILDRIPFKRSFRFDMELWHWWEGTVPAMSVVTYWYAHPGATSNRTAIKPADLTVVQLPPYVPPHVAGALEGEELGIVHRTGNPGPQEIDQCSSEQHLWWRQGQPGDRLVLEFPAETGGLHRVFARFVRAGDYGIVQLRVNGAEAGPPLDLYHDGVVVSDELLLGEFALHAGTNYLAIEIVGANEKAVKNYMAGLDYLRLEPVD